MISDLKRRTAGRDMYKVLSELEGRDITPPRKNYSMSPPPNDARNGKRHESKRYGRCEDDDDTVERADPYSASRYSSKSKTSGESKPKPESRAAGSYRYYNS